jgi:hypothetical protein
MPCESSCIGSHVRQFGQLDTVGSPTKRGARRKSPSRGLGGMILHPLPPPSPPALGPTCSITAVSRLTMVLAGSLSQPKWRNLLKASCWRCGARQCGTKCYPYNPSLGLFCGTCLHTTSDDDQTRPEHTTQIHSKHHHHGGGSARPSSNMDLMNQDDRMCGQPGGGVG